MRKTTTPTQKKWEHLKPNILKLTEKNRTAAQTIQRGAIKMQQVQKEMDDTAQRCMQMSSFCIRRFTGGNHSDRMARDEIERAIINATDGRGGYEDKLFDDEEQTGKGYQRKDINSEILGTDIHRKANRQQKKATASEENRQKKNVNQQKHNPSICSNGKQTARIKIANKTRDASNWRTQATNKGNDGKTRENSTPYE